MSDATRPHHHEPTLAEHVLADTGASAFACYQCGKCTAGCPLAAEMDHAPHQILRLLQLDLPGTDDEVLASAAIWLCVTCETCVSRCPQEVDLPRIMDRLREESRARGLAHPKAKDILAFHDAFLGSIEKGGRLHEVGLIAAYKLKTGHLLQDVPVAPKLMARGKLSLRPPAVEGRDAVARIFTKCRREKP
jgi:heterodisulfide reductase subunit C2